MPSVGVLSLLPFLASSLLIITTTGIQEGLVRQVTDLQELFGDTWAHVGVGRDDGVTSGEFSAIFYNTQTLELQANDTFWLSETPLEPSRFPGAGSVRLATYTRFHLASGGGRGNVTVLNTHFDDQSNGQRELGASMLLLRARYEAVQSKGPVFVMGDFNRCVYARFRFIEDYLRRGRYI